MSTVKAKRGRPSKFNRPSRVVALTLPDDVAVGLRKVHPDPAWAVVTLFEKHHGLAPTPIVQHADVELVAIPDRQFLIAVNRNAFKRLPGIDVIPMNGDRAFLALEPGRGVSELELAVIDRLEQDPLEPRERRALGQLRAQLRAWRRDPTLVFEQRAIIVARRVAPLMTRRRPRSKS